MIDPKNITNFQRTPEQLEEFLLFAIVVAGKNSFQQARKLEDFLSPWRSRGYTPFGAIRTMDMDETLVDFLRSVKMGQYNRVSTAFRGIARFFRYDDANMRFHPIQTVDVKHLECIKGIGMKTARFFVMHTRPTWCYACLDTHILQWLGERGYPVPKTTPHKKQYLELEKIFVSICTEMKISPSELDLKIWNEKH